VRPAALQEAADEAVFGGKAVQLGAAIRAGLPVPGGMALSAALVDAIAAAAPAATAALRDAWSAIEGPLAVRSSAVGEDSETASFAGQHLTCLNVNSAEALLQAVRAIRESAHAAAALGYRDRLGIAGPPRIGVVIQRLVIADRAGVLFTQDPIDGRDERVIEASWGLGEAVVAGLVTPDRYRVRRDGRVVERTPGTKSVAVRVVPGEGTREEPVAAERVRALCLGDDHLHRLHALASRCEDIFGGAQDLEWAFAGEALYLLQRRAITQGAR
jgi:pyruvate,water dikinase